MAFFSRSSSELLGIFISSKSYQKLYSDFSLSCHEFGLDVSIMIQNEFSKRCASLSQQSKKSKLNLSKCSLSDAHVQVLCESLKKIPVILKLNIEKNDISNLGKAFVLECLEYQLKFFLETPIDVLIDQNIVLLSYISIRFSDDTIDGEIKKISRVLLFCNAMMKIKKSTNYICGESVKPSSKISLLHFTELWIKLFSASPSSNDTTQAVLYSEVEDLILKEFLRRKTIKSIDEEIRQLLLNCAITQEAKRQGELRLLKEKEDARILADETQRLRDIAEKKLRFKEKSDEKKERRLMFEEEQYQLDFHKTASSKESMPIVELIDKDTVFVPEIPSEETPVPYESQVSRNAQFLTLNIDSGSSIRFGNIKFIRTIILNGNLKKFDFNILSEAQVIENLTISNSDIEHISGQVPKTIKSLDLSRNKIQDVTCLLRSVSLISLNVSYNKIKSPIGFPVNLKLLDISFNIISSTTHLRVLSTCSKLNNILIVGNPILHLFPADWKVILVSILPSLEIINNTPLPLVTRNVILASERSLHTPPSKISKIEQITNDSRRSSEKSLHSEAIDYNYNSKAIKKISQFDADILFARLSSCLNVQRASSKAKSNIILRNRSEITIQIKTCLTNCLEALNVLLSYSSSTGPVVTSESISQFRMLNVYPIVTSANNILHASNSPKDNFSLILRNDLEIASKAIYYLFQQCRLYDDFSKVKKAIEVYFEANTSVIYHFYDSKTQLKVLEDNTNLNSNSKLLFDKLSNLKDRIVNNIDKYQSPIHPNQSARFA